MSYDRNAVTAPGPGLRLLPWESGQGKPCFLSSDKHSGVLSLLADDIEEEQLRDGAAVLDGAGAVLRDDKAGEYALRRTLGAATQCLGDVLRVADSRGARLLAAEDAYESDESDERDESHEIGQGR
jgi:hypothetical protein